MSKLPSSPIRELLTDTWVSLTSPLPDYDCLTQRPWHLLCRWEPLPGRRWPHPHLLLF